MLGVSQLLESLLFEVRPLEPWSYLAAAVLLFGMSLLAGYLPARRATAMNIVDVVKAE